MEATNPSPRREDQRPRGGRQKDPGRTPQDLLVEPEVVVAWHRVEDLPGHCESGRHSGIHCCPKTMRWVGQKSNLVARRCVLSASPTQAKSGLDGIVGIGQSGSGVGLDSNMTETGFLPLLFNPSSQTSVNAGIICAIFTEKIRSTVEILSISGTFWRFYLIWLVVQTIGN